MENRRIKVEIEGNDKTVLRSEIMSIRFKHDSDDDAKAVDTNGVTGLVIEGDLDANDAKASCLKLAEWSIQTTGADIYRKVSIVVYNTTGNALIRQIEFSHMFVVDYSENYISDSSGKSVFKLVLNQRKNDSSIKIQA